MRREEPLGTIVCSVEAPHLPLPVERGGAGDVAVEIVVANHQRRVVGKLVWIPDVGPHAGHLLSRRGLRGCAHPRGPCQPRVEGASHVLEHLERRRLRSNGEVALDVQRAEDAPNGRVHRIEGKALPRLRRGVLVVEHPVAEVELGRDRGRIQRWRGIIGERKRVPRSQHVGRCFGDNPSDRRHGAFCRQHDAANAPEPGPLQKGSPIESRREMPQFGDRHPIVRASLALTHGGNARLEVDNGAGARVGVRPVQQPEHFRDVRTVP